jgi:7-dehydrocholesterol reductase
MVSFLRNTLFPLFLMLSCPPAALVFFYINTKMDGSLLTFLHQVLNQGLTQTIWAIWQPHFFGNAIAWEMIGIFMLVQLILMRIIPGKKVTGPETPKGNIPVYQDNGFTCFLLTVALFYVSSYSLQLFSPTIIYDHFMNILGALNIFSLLFCLFLCIKGRVAPSSSDHSTSGNFIFDYYWGTELYPRLFGWDIKQFTNCRFGMMSWSLIILSFAAKQAQLSGLTNSMIVCVSIMLIYIAKFFWWESGYLRSIDIMHDRAGFYICWGCLVWVPAIYTIPAAYLVNHPYQFNIFIAAGIFSLGALSVLLNYLADAQRQKVRATNGNCKVWGRKPHLIHTTYVDQNGVERNSLLLASGWWGVARHFHYLLEISLAFFWTLPVLFAHFLPWFYVVFLAILLIHRSYRDEARCSAKYGKYWEQYCELVPNKIIPWNS